ncbi:MAG: ABC transporter ATP-binding protein [Clostridia bacterium]
MSTAHDSWIVADSLGKTYGSAVAIRSLSFTLDAGTHWAVTGPSGSGKSTLLYLLGALDRPTSGHLRIGGRNLSELDPNARAAYRYSTVDFVFQEFHLLGDLTVEENVLLPFVGRPRDRRTHQDRALWLLQQVGLEAHRRQPAGVLSGGEKQRVAIARALVNDPPLLLCDEPTGNLDQTTGAQVMDLLQSLAAADPLKTLIVVTHDPSVACRFLHQLHLRDGALVDSVPSA